MDLLMVSSFAYDHGLPLGVAFSFLSQFGRREDEVARVIDLLLCQTFPMKAGKGSNPLDTAFLAFLHIAARYDWG